MGGREVQITKKKREELVEENMLFHERIQAIEEGFIAVGGIKEEL